MKLVTTLMAAAAMTLLIAGPVSAQTISMEQAKKIAADKGMTTVTEAEYDNGKWELEGRDASNRKLELDIDGESGAVVKMEKD